MSSDRHYLLSARDKAAFTVFILGAPIDLCYELHVTTHYAGLGHPVNYVYYAFLIFAAVQVYWNLYYVTTQDNRTSLHHETDLSKQSNGDTGSQALQVCDKCQRIKPYQSHHCKICDVCIDRRDHHCWFAGNCIGSNNQRHFLVMIFYIWSAALIQNIYNLQFVCHVLGCNIKSLVSVCAPHFPIFLREYSLYILLINFMTFLGCLLLAMFSMLLYAQVKQLLTGKTKYELNKGIPVKGKTTITMNLERILGQRWVIVWLLPCVDSNVKAHNE